MTGRDLLCAIARIDDGIVLASGQFAEVESSIKADRKRIRQRFTAIGISAVLCIAVFGAVKVMPNSLSLFAPSNTTERQTPEGNDASGTGDIAVVTEPRTTGDKESAAPLEGPSDHDQPEQNGDYAAMINISGTVYIDTYEKYYEEIDENSIRRSVSYTDEYPHNDGEQNFDRKNVDYVIIGSDTVICRINGEWTIFRFFAFAKN